MKRVRLQKLPGRTLLLAILSLSVLSLGMEALARTRLAAVVFPIVSYGSSHVHFNTQVERLLDRAAQDGPLDCVFLGDSQVIYGIDPGVLEPLLAERLGRPVRCQNFGLGGITTLSVGPLARLVMRRVQPSLLILGTSSLSYFDSTLDASRESIVGSPWLAYQLGEPTVDGWLLENSHAYRYYDGTSRFLFDGASTNPEIQPNGHSNKFDDPMYLTPAEQQGFFDDLYSRAVLSPMHIAALRELLAMEGNQAQIIIVEMPIDPVYFSLSPRLLRNYPKFLAMIQGEASRYGVPLYLARERLPIPDDGWHDLVHLDRKGTVFFSESLADIIAPYLAGETSAP